MSLFLLRIIARKIMKFAIKIFKKGFKNFSKYDTIKVI